MLSVICPIPFLLLGPIPEITPVQKEKLQRTLLQSRVHTTAHWAELPATSHGMHSSGRATPAQDKRCQAGQMTPVHSECSYLPFFSFPFSQPPAFPCPGFLSATLSSPPNPGPTNPSAPSPLSCPCLGDAMCQAPGHKKAQKACE